MQAFSHASVIEFAGKIALQLGKIDGVIAVVLGGSWARGAGTPNSDIDLGIYYDPAAPPSLDALRALGAKLDDSHSGDVVTNFGDWGPWINGGGWLTIEGQRVDWIYRDYPKVSSFIERNLAGKTQAYYQTGHPHAFQEHVYMGEVSYCISLYDPVGKLAALKALTVPYPPALRDTIIHYNLWEAGFCVDICRKSAARGDVFHVTGCMFRCVACLVQVIFALNGQYWINEKGSVKSAAGFALSPVDFEARVNSILGELRQSGDSLLSKVEQANVLVIECGELVSRFNDQK